MTKKFTPVISKVEKYTGRCIIKRAQIYSYMQRFTFPFNIRSRMQTVAAVMHNDSTPSHSGRTYPFFSARARVGENYLGGEGNRKIRRCSAVGDENNQDDQQLHGVACMLEPLRLL